MTVRTGDRDAAAPTELRVLLAEALRGRIWMGEDAGRLPERTTERFAHVVRAPDPVGPRRQLLNWWRLLTAAGWLELVSAECVAPTAAARGWFQRGPEIALHALLDDWLHGPHGDALDWVNLDVLGGQLPLSNPETRVPHGLRRQLAAATLRVLPSDEWVETARFIDHVADLGLLPVVSHTYRFSTYVGGSHRFLPVDHPAAEPWCLGLPYLMGVLVHVFATLGAVELAWARPPGAVLRPRPGIRVGIGGPYNAITHLRLTSRGAAWTDPFVRPGEARTRPGGPPPVDFDALADLLDF